MHSFCKYSQRVVYIVATVLRRVARVKKNISRSERETFFVSVVLLVILSVGTQMSVSSALWWANI